MPEARVPAFGDGLADAVFGAFSEEALATAHASARPLDGMSLRDVTMADARAAFFENDETHVYFPADDEISTFSLGHVWELPEDWDSAYGHLRPHDSVAVIDEPYSDGELELVEGDEVEALFPDGTTTTFTMGPVWRYVGWRWPTTATEMAEELKRGLYTALLSVGPVWGFVTVSDRIDPFKGLGYSLGDFDWGRAVSGYGWITLIDQQHAHRLDGTLLERCVEDGLRVTSLGATLAIELPDRPVAKPEWYDRVDELIAPVRVERRGHSRGHHTEATMRTLSALDAALCYTGDPHFKAPERHPDPVPFTSKAQAARDERWPDKDHRPALSWYETGDQ